MKKVVVVDFPSEFLFPPLGYGGIERWLWSMAKQSEALGHSVVLSGPLWRSEHLESARHFKPRLGVESISEFLDEYGKADYLIAGHEYWNDPETKAVFEAAALQSLTFQMMPNYRYKGTVFDNKKHFLFCYSQEMMDMYRTQDPNLCLCLGEGINEEPRAADDHRYLVWIGRLDEDKAPHLAVMVSRLLKMRLKIIGSPQYDSLYYKKYISYFEDPLVEMMGTLSGAQKMDVLAAASSAIYSCSSSWIEAAGMIFAEYARSGIPTAALTWREGTAAQHAVDEGNTGFIARAQPSDSDELVAAKLAKAVQGCLTLNRAQVWREGNRRFSPQQLTEKMLRRLED